MLTALAFRMLGNTDDRENGGSPSVFDCSKSAPRSTCTNRMCMHARDLYHPDVMEAESSKMEEEWRAEQEERAGRVEEGQGDGPVDQKGLFLKSNVGAWTKKIFSLNFAFLIPFLSAQFFSCLFKYVYFFSYVIVFIRFCTSFRFPCF